MECLYTKKLIRTPLFEQVRELLLQHIKNKVWAPGERLPSESTLSTELGVSIGTIHHALDCLCDEGILFRKSGSGVFIQSLQKKGYVNRFHPFKTIDGTDFFTQRRLIDCRKIDAQPHVARALQISPSSQVWLILRHLVNTAGRVSVAECYLPPTEFKSFSKNHFLKTFKPEDSLLKYYEREFGLVTILQKCKVRCETVSDDYASFLHIQSGSVFLRADRISFTFSRKPIEYRINHYLADNIEVQFDLS